MRKEVVTLFKNIRFQRDPKEDVLGTVLLLLTVGMHCFSSCGTSLLLFCILRGAGGYCQWRARTCSYTVNIPAQRDMYGIENKCKHKKTLCSEQKISFSAFLFFCLSDFSSFGHWDKIPKKNTCRKGRLALALSFRGFSPWLLAGSFQSLMRHNMAAEACDREGSLRHKQSRKTRDRGRSNDTPHPNDALQ